MFKVKIKDQDLEFEVFSEEYKDIRKSFKKALGFEKYKNITININFLEKCGKGYQIIDYPVYNNGSAFIEIKSNSKLILGKRRLEGNLINTDLVNFNK